MVSDQDEWGIDVSHAPRSKFKKFRKRHPKEFAALFSNLEKIIQFFQSGLTLAQINVNFFRSESHGLFRIGQTGVVSAKESRLYVYPDEDQKTIHVLGIGTKDEQSRDLKAAQKTVSLLKREDDHNE